MFPRKCEPVDTPGVIALDGRETDVDKSGDNMKRVNWTRKNRTIVGAGLAVLLFLGLTGMVRFPSVVRISRTVVCLPDEHRHSSLSGEADQVYEEFGLLAVERSPFQVLSVENRPHHSAFGVQSSPGEHRPSHRQQPERLLLVDGLADHRGAGARFQ